MHERKGSYHTHKLCSNEVDIGIRTVLDTWPLVNDDGSIKTKMYRKETYTEKYKHFSSNHPLEYKGGVVKTLMHSLDTIYE